MFIVAYYLIKDWQWMQRIRYIVSWKALWKFWERLPFCVSGSNKVQFCWFSKGSTVTFLLIMHAQTNTPVSKSSQFDCLKRKDKYSKFKWTWLLQKLNSQRDASFRKNVDAMFMECPLHPRRRVFQIYCLLGTDFYLEQFHGNSGDWKINRYWTWMNCAPLEDGGQNYEYFTRIRKHS